MAIGPRIVTPDFEEEFEATDVVIESDEDEDGEVEVEVDEGHGANLAEILPDKDLVTIATDVIDWFDTDVRSRKEWAEGYVKGLELLGMKIEDRQQPWQGASGVFHPILTETIIRFQAHAMSELLPAAGPARSKIVAKMTPEVLDQAQRVESELNYQTMEEMEEYREESERLFFHLPLAGSAFKKIFFDPTLDRARALFVPAEDMVVGYGATDLESAERFTHVMKKTEDELAELMDVGFYKDSELGTALAEPSDIQDKYDEISGQNVDAISDERHTVLEAHVMMKIDDPENDSDLARPYVVTVNKSTRDVMAIRRNWIEGDSRYKKRMHFVHYRYLPGMGFYGIGLIHLLGGLTKTATSILRQLIDAGTLANLPAGLKSRGLRIKGDNTPFQPGEFRDVDVPGSSIRDNIAFLPYKEPSGVLYQLLGNVIEEARRIGSVADADIANINKEMPVGTTFALLERQMKIMSGVQARMHSSLKKELKIIARIIHDFMGESYSWDSEANYNRREDFDGRVDIVPVSDPNAATTAQRVVSYQAALDLASRAPHLYNMGKLHRQMLEVLQIDDASEIIKLPDDIKPADPVTENMAILKQEPVRAFMYQDHESHIATHQAALEDPKIQQMVGQSPFASAIQGAMTAHITEHLAFAYRRKIEEKLGVPMPDPEAPLPEDVEVQLSRVLAPAAGKLLAANQQEDAEAQQAEEENDPLTIIQTRELDQKDRELDLKEREFAHRQAMDKAEKQLDGFSKGANIGHQRARLESEEMRAAASISARLATELAQSEERMMDKITEAFRFALDQAARLKDGIDHKDEKRGGKDVS